MLAGLLLSVWSATTASAQIQMFVKFTATNGAPVITTGDSTNTVYPGSAGWSVLGNFTLGGQTSGSVFSFNTPTFNKTVNQATPTLFQAMATTAYSYNVTVVVVKPNTTGGQAYLTYDFRRASIIEQDLSGSQGDDNPAEVLKVAPQAVRLTYQTILANGNLGTTYTGMWNVICNCSTF